MVQTRSITIIFQVQQATFLTMQSQFFGFQRPETKLINTEILKFYAIYATLLLKTVKNTIPLTLCFEILQKKTNIQSILLL